MLLNMQNNFKRIFYLYFIYILSTTNFIAFSAVVKWAELLMRSKQLSIDLFIHYLLKYFNAYHFIIY